MKNIQDFNFLSAFKAVSDNKINISVELYITLSKFDIGIIKNIILLILTTEYCNSIQLL